MNVFDKVEKKLTTAIYATTQTGNKRMSVDGKFYTDKQFNKRYEIVGEDLTMHFKVHTARFLQELAINLHSQRSDGMGGGGVMYVPLNVFRELLLTVGEEAARINDHRLNKMMILLGIYSIACPESEDYDPDKIHRILANDLTAYEK